MRDARSKLVELVLVETSGAIELASNCGSENGEQICVEPGVAFPPPDAAPRWMWSWEDGGSEPLEAANAVYERSSGIFGEIVLLGV